MGPQKQESVKKYYIQVTRIWHIISAEVIKSAELGESHKEESVLIDDRNMALPIDPKVL